MWAQNVMCLVKILMSIFSQNLKAHIRVIIVSDKSTYKLCAFKFWDNTGIKQINLNEQKYLITYCNVCC